MEESGELSAEGSAHHGPLWVRRRLREQQAEQSNAQDIQSLSDERAKALLEYRARCTSARFWIQSQLLDLRVGGLPPSSSLGGASGGSQPSSPAAVAAAGGAVSSGVCSKGSDPGVVGDLPSLMRRYLTCPLLSKLLQQDPLLSGKLATLDHVLWQRRSKHEPPTSGWMGHDSACPDGCSLGLPLASTEAVGPSPAGGGEAAQVGTGANGSCSSASSRTSTVDSMPANEGCSADSQTAPSVEDESRPVTAWVSCVQCMEHFAYIAASLLVFLKPSELRDLAVERHAAQCCGFVFCGRRNVATPEKRRAALWRWTLDFRGGSKALSEDELVQFCCSRCCNRQQQLLRLLDEEPMYSRPGIKEWIGDALQRKAAYIPHPHGLSELHPAEGEMPPCATEEPQAGDSKLPDASAATGLLDRQLGRNAGGSVGAAIGMEDLVDEGAGSLVEPLLERQTFGISSSTKPSSRDFTKQFGSLELDTFRVPVTVEDDDESSTDETPPKSVDSQQGREASAQEEKAAAAVAARVGGASASRGSAVTSSPSFLMLDYGSASSTPEGASACVDEALLGRNASCSPSRTGATDPAEPGLTPTLPVVQREAVAPCLARCSRACSSKLEEALVGSEKQPQGHRREASPPSLPATANTRPTEHPLRSRSTRVRFADDDDDGADGALDGDSAVCFFKHFLNMQDEDDGLRFYSNTERHTTERQAALSGAPPAGSHARSGGAGELRSILKPATEPLDPTPSPADSAAEVQVGYMRLSDVVIAFDLLSSCCTDASARFLQTYHRRFCTCACEGAAPAAEEAAANHSESEEPLNRAAVPGEGGSRSMHARKANPGDESDSMSCLDGESGDEIEPTELWKRRQQQLLKGILRSLPPSANGFIRLVTELCETFQPLQRRPPPSSPHAKREGSETADVATSFYFDDALTIAREEDVGLELVDFVRSTIHQSAPCTGPVRPICGGSDGSNAAEAAEEPVHHPEESAIHALLESIFSRMSHPIIQLCETARASVLPAQ
ncbi:uncharacterized protein LOC34620804 [Cyclospora cayetanensis]|uniref:Uncharacterized protein LOC34620804 n=1 Tax=Cyclospora cayetanensis TaxID=88456 RepID=A0A6P6S2X9_9EIME|nr:uncharacterized protein LOC34620804 [Cyclospora cayetanensis]